VLPGALPADLRHSVLASFVSLAVDASSTTINCAVPIYGEGEAKLAVVLAVLSSAYEHPPSDQVLPGTGRCGATPGDATTRNQVRWQVFRWAGQVG
jgi:hypothetical protein